MNKIGDSEKISRHIKKKKQEKLAKAKIIQILEDRELNIWNKLNL